MKNRRLTYTQVLTVALAALSASVALAQTNTLPTTYVYPLSAADTNAPGFTWNVSQVVVAVNPGSVAFAESELVGDQGTNLADPEQVYSSAAGPATVPSDPFLPISFSIPAVINFSISAPDCTDNRPDLPCEDGMVGTPGNPPDINGGTDNIAAEALTYLALPQGLVTMGVRSDDGFRLQIGAANPGDRYSSNAFVPLVYDGTRGAGDTTNTFYVPQAGLYAARLLYLQQGGGANVEWYTFPAAGTTNATLGMDNTGTNAVLVGDVADSGIAAYQSISAAPLASYCSSLVPSPGSTGVAIEPTISATIVNGTVPVSGVTLTVDGTALTPTLQTTASGVSVSYAFTTPLPDLLSHTLVLAWNDNGTQLGVTSTFTAQGFHALASSQIVTPDTTKPGFRFNIFANLSDSLVSSKNGVQGGESDNLDNIELGLNGLDPDGFGGFLPNMVDITANGAAQGAAPALGGPNAPAEFIITNTINLTGANMPGFPAEDGSSDPSHSEALTYVHLPVGLTTFTLNLHGFYRAYMGSLDYTTEVQVGTLNDAASGDTTFSVVAPTAGYYPLRVTVFNLDGNPVESISTVGPKGTNVLVGDVANGGLAAYYALSTPSEPYVRYTSPRPVPRQVEYPNDRVLVRIQDGDIATDDSTAVLNMDGKAVTTTNDRVGDVYEMTWTPTTLQTPAEIHTGVLTYKDSSGSSLSNQWSFLNLKAVWLDTAQEDYYVPTNAIVEDFSEYEDPTEFTNDIPTGNWYFSPQPENPLVDVCPIWTNTPAGPTNWYVWNHDNAGDGTWNQLDPNSDAYANFLCVDLSTFSQIEGSILDTAPGEMINGQPLAALVPDVSKNLLVAESDNRANPSPGQTQFAISKRFDLSNVANPVLAFAAIQKQNQDNLNAVEYSIDGGATWAPVIYYLDGHELGSDDADIHVNSDNTVNVNSTLFHDTNPGEVPTWNDSSGDVNSTFAAGLGAPISQALAPFFAPRVNDDNYDGKRIEVVRLPLAAHQSNVRLRLSQLATCSWYFGIAEIAFYDVAPSGAVVPTGLPPASGPTLSISAASGQITITWTGSGTLQSATSLTKPGTWTAVTPAPTGNTYTAPIGAGAKFFRLAGN